MSERQNKMLLAASLLPLLAFCLFTGSESSIFRFAYPPLLILLSLRLPPNAILLTGFVFSSGYAAMAVSDMPLDNREIIRSAAEFLFYTLTALAASTIARTIAKERSQFRLAETTFQGLSSELSTRTMNLQTALDSLSMVHATLQSLDRNKTAFFGNIAHEFRTPLSGIRSYSEILLTYEDLDIPTQREFLEIIQNESIRLTTLVNDLLNLIKIETGNIELALGRVSSTELIEESIKLMQPMAAAKKLNLVSDTPAECIYLKADSGQVKQVLINLLNNAIKFTQQGGITVGVVAREQFAEFFVADSGEGVFTDEQEKIFDEFYRVLDNVPNRPPGTGLGLSICKKIVEFHEGRIWVESSIGKGSTFRFTIPLFMAEEHLQTVDEKKVHIDRPDEFRPILVAMRNTVKRMCLRKSLENVGYKTFGAASYEKACLFAKSSPVDIIVADISSKMDDIKPLLAIANAEGIPFYMGHFYAEPPEIITLVINGYLWMPVDQLQLLPLLESLSLQRKKIFIFSSDMDESRLLQMILGIEGYTTSLSSNDGNFLHSCISFLPEAIIIGSFEEDQIDSIIKEIRATEQIANLPLMLVLKEKPPRNIKLVTLPPQGEKPLLFGLSPLVQKIEGELFK